MSESSTSESSPCPRCGAPLRSGEICLRCASRIAFGAELTAPPDLAMICRKCLAQEPEARYANAAELVEDLECLLQTEPVRAHLRGRPGRAWRWARCHPRVAVLSATVMVLLVAVGVGAWLAAMRPAGVPRQETGLHQKSETELLEESLRLHQALVLRNPRNAAWLMGLGDSAQNLAQAAGHHGNLARAGELLRIAEDAERRAVALEPADSKNREVLALTLGRLGDYWRKVAKIDDAMKAYDEKSWILGELVVQEPKNEKLRVELAAGLGPPAEIDLARGRFHDAREALQRAAGILDPTIAANPANREWQIIRIHLLTNLGIACHGDKDTGEALTHFQRVWNLSHEHPEMLTAYPRWAADCRLAADRATALLREFAEQERKAGRVEAAVTAEAAAAKWRSRADTLPAP